VRADSIRSLYYQYMAFKEESGAAGHHPGFLLGWKSKLFKHSAEKKIPECHMEKIKPLSKIKMSCMSPQNFINSPVYATL